MKPMDKGWIVWLALVMGFIGALPVSGQSAVSWGGSTLGYDSAGRLECVFSSRMELMATFEYDGAGNLAWRVMPDQDVTSYGYDGMNRLVAVTNQGSVVSSMRYDRNGNTVAHASPLASGSLGYDAMNHLIASTQTVNSAIAIVRYGYDLNGNRTNIVYPGGLTVGYVHGADNRLDTVWISAPSAPLREIHFSYDTANRMTSISYPNGINSAFGYDAESRVTNIVHGSFINRAIQRNALGFKETELINAGLKPTVPATARSIKTHNDADQLVSESIQTDVANWTSVIYSYSANGCLTNQQSEIGNRHYQYDYDNRLESVSSAQSAVQYLYDATGARIGRIVEATPSSLCTNYFVIDHTDALKRPLAETDASGNVTRFYVWCGSQLLCHIDVNGTVRYYHADELGSTLALTDVSGNVTDQFAYMPYGYATHTGSTETPFQWLGGYGVYYDSDTDLHLTLHRAYSSKMKRFIHPDPLGIDGGPNVYAYANLNPAYFVDPLGLWAAGTFFRGLVGAVVSGVGAVIGAAAATTGVGSVPGGALALYSSYQFGANVGNMVNSFRDVEPAPTGPIAGATVLATDSRTARNIAEAADLAIPLALSIGTSPVAWSRLPTTPVGPAGTLAGTLQRVPGDPAVIYPWIQGFQIGDAGLAAYDAWQWAWDSDSNNSKPCSNGR